MADKTKKSSYKKMQEKYQAKIDKLTQDIITLVKDENSEDAIRIKIKWKMQLDFEKSIKFGEYNETDNAQGLWH